MRESSRHLVSSYSPRSTERAIVNQSNSGRVIIKNAEISEISHNILASDRSIEKTEDSKITLKLAVAENRITLRETAKDRAATNCITCNMFLMAYSYWANAYHWLDNGLPKLISLSFTFIGLCGDIVVSLTLSVYYYDSILLTILIAMLCLIVLLLINMANQAYLIIEEKEVSWKTKKRFLIIASLLICFSVIAAIGVEDSNWDMSLILFVCSYAVCFVPISLQSSFLLVLPVCLIILIFEFIIRVILCKFKCEDKNAVEITYPTYYYENKDTESTECVICLAPYENNDVVCVLGCHKRHMFHEQCLREWLPNETKCPICRSSISFN